MESLKLFFFNDTATTEIYTLSLHDALPISGGDPPLGAGPRRHDPREQPARCRVQHVDEHAVGRSEEHTSELQSRQYLVCRLLLEKKRSTRKRTHQPHLCSSVSPALATSITI